MAATVQVSAHVDPDTKGRLDRLTRRTGLKKAHVIEQALLHHLAALEALPAEAIVPARLTVSEEDYERLIGLIQAPGEPTPAFVDMRAGRLLDDPPND